MFPIGPWPVTDEKFAFVASLIGDLSCLGYELHRESGTICFSQRLPGPAADCREFYREAHVKLHRMRLRDHADQIASFEKEFGSDVFVDGATLNLAAIQPRLRPVDLRKKANASRRDQKIVQYLRAYQTVGSHMSVGRENAFILEDIGHGGPAVMGILVLASPRYYQPRRDEVFGWLSPSQLNVLSETRRKKQVRVRMAGLNRIMQVAICCALPPYSHLGAARLLAIAPLTSSVRDDFANRWYDRRGNRDPDLAAVTTTTSMGLTGTPFQALRPAKFIDSQNAAIRGKVWNKDGLIYSRLGLSHPWRRGIPIQSQELFADFSALVSDATRSLAFKLVGSGSRDTKSVLQQAMLAVGITPSIFRGNPIGFFLGAIDQSAVEALVTGKPRVRRPLLSWDIAVQQFRSDFGEAEHPTKMPGLDPVSRSEAVARRRDRAKRVQYHNILLSNAL
jgi:hypothetical protein